MACWWYWLPRPWAKFSGSMAKGVAFISAAVTRRPGGVADRYAENDARRPGGDAGRYAENDARRLGRVAGHSAEQDAQWLHDFAGHGLGRLPAPLDVFHGQVRLGVFLIAGGCQQVTVRAAGRFPLDATGIAVGCTPLVQVVDGFRSEKSLRSQPREVRGVCSTGSCALGGEDYNEGMTRMSFSPSRFRRDLWRVKNLERTGRGGQIPIRPPHVGTNLTFSLATSGFRGVANRCRSVFWRPTSSQFFSWTWTFCSSSTDWSSPRATRYCRTTSRATANLSFSSNGF